MKKRCFIVLMAVFILIIGNVFLINYNKKNSLIGVYLDNVESTFFPDKNSNYVVDKVVCDNDALASWDNNNWSLFVDNISKRSNCKIYFRSKKDITITYDNNYIKNNIFEDIYNTSHLIINDTTGSYSKYITYKINKENGIAITLNNQIGEYEATKFSGVYFNYKNTALTPNKVYTFYFEAKGSENLSIEIGSEQTKNRMVELTDIWQKFRIHFTASLTSNRAFIIYGWVSPSISRTIELKNLSLQEGEYNNFSTTSLKEYDTLNSTLPTPTRDNYTFLGWYTDPIEGEKISSETQVTEDTTFYAHWQYNE